MSIAAIQTNDVVALAEEPHARRCGQLAVVVGQAVGLVGFVGPDHGDPDVGARERSRDAASNTSR